MVKKTRLELGVMSKILKFWEKLGCGVMSGVSGKRKTRRSRECNWFFYRRYIGRDRGGFVRGSCRLMLLGECK